jgi:hypothetical protein
MAQTIKIKRSTSTSAPSSLTAGELAYSDASDKLFIGQPSDNAVTAIGGKVYVDMLDHTAGALTASSAIVVDASSKIDQLKTANLTIGANSITSGSGDVDIVAAANLDIDAGTINLDTQATEFKIIDNSATALTITEGSTTYMTFVTTNSGEKIVTGKSLVVDGNGSSGGTTISDGLIDIRTGTGNVSKIKFYCESSNAHFQTLQAAPHSAGASNVLVLPSAGSNLISDTATQTLTNKTLTSPDINTPDIDGGTIDGTVIGGSSQAAISGTTITATNTLTDGTASISSGAGTGFTSLAVDNVSIDTNTISVTNSNGNLTISPNGTGTIVVPSGYKNRSQFGSNSLATKEYVDAVKQSLDIKDSVLVATTAALNTTYNNGAGTLTGNTNVAFASDGVTPAQGSRVLVKNQSNAEENGIYSLTTAGDGSTAFVLTRADDANAASELTGGTFVFVESGTAGGDNGFVFTHNGAPTLGTTDLTVAQFSGAGQITAGDGLSKTGNQLDVNDDNITLEINSDNLRIKGITATAVGDLLIGAASNAGYTRLVKPSGNATAHDYILSMNTSGAAQWSNTLDGGTF